MNKEIIKLVLVIGLSFSAFANEKQEMKSIKEWLGSEDFFSLTEEAKVSDSFILTARCLTLTSVHLSILNHKENSHMKKSEIKKLRESLSKRMEILTLLGKAIFQDRFNYQNDDDFNDQFTAYTFTITELFAKSYMDLALNTLDQSNNILDNDLLASDHSICNNLANRFY